MAEGSRLIEVLDQDGAVEATADASVPPAWPDDVIVERVPVSELDTLRERGAGTFELILYRGDGGDGSGWGVISSIIEAAPRLLSETGTLALALGNGGSTDGSDGNLSAIATIRRSLDTSGFRSQRWLVPYPSHRDPRVVIDERLSDAPDGPELARALARSAVEAVWGAGSTFADRLMALGAGRDAGLDLAITDARMGIASRADPPAGDGDRDGWMWILPQPGRVHPWRTGWMLVRGQADGSWGLVPQGDTRDVMSGPLLTKPRAVTVAAGRNAEEVIAAVLDEHGVGSTQAREWLSAWWSACRGLLAARSAEGLPIDVGPHRFIVSRDGGWRFVGDGMYHRFGIPAESLAYGAMLRMIGGRLRMMGLPRGLPDIISAGRASTLLLESIGVTVGDEHVLLWQELEVDLASRTGPPGVDRARHRLKVRALEDEPLWGRVFEQPLERQLETLLEGRLASIVTELGREVARLRAEVRRERRRLERQSAAAATARDELVARSRHVHTTMERQEEEMWDRIEAIRQDAREKDATVDGLQRELMWRDWQLAWHRALPSRLERGSDGRSLLDEERDIVTRSHLFDASWYLERYTDVAEAGMDPGFHYVRHGSVEGRDPGPRFDTRAYVLEHPEIVADGANPIVHEVRRRAGGLVAIPIHVRSLSRAAMNSLSVSKRGERA